MVALPTRRCPRTCSSIRQFAAPGIPVTLNTDDPQYVCTTIGREYAARAAGRRRGRAHGRCDYVSMKRGLTIGVMVGLLIGSSATAVGAVVISGELYSYAPAAVRVAEVVKATEGDSVCEPINVGSTLWLRCPRFRLLTR